MSIIIYCYYIFSLLYIAITIIIIIIDNNITTTTLILWLTHLPLDKMAATSQMTVSNAFSWMKISIFRSNFTEICSEESNWQFGSGNGLAPYRQQSIT